MHPASQIKGVTDILVICQLHSLFMGEWYVLNTSFNFLSLS